MESTQQMALEATLAVIKISLENLDKAVKNKDLTTARKEIDRIKEWLNKLRNL